MNTAARFFITGVTAIAVMTPALPAVAQSWDPWWQGYGNHSCMRDAVERRDDSLISAYNAYNSSMIAAIRRRTSAHLGMWSDSRGSYGQDLSTANRDFHTSSTNAERRLSDARDAAAERFAEDERRCRVGSHTWYEPSSCSIECPSAPIGCRYSDRRIVNGCITHCGRLVCEESRRSTYYENYEWRYDNYNNGMCRTYGSCRSGQGCPSGTVCSGYPAYGCYQYGCPYPIGSSGGYYDY